MIKAVIFDIDNTLYKYKEANDAGYDAVCKMTCLSLGITKEAFHAAWNEARKKTITATPNLASSHSRMLYAQKTLEILGYKPITFALKMHETFWNEYLEHMVLEHNLVSIMDFFSEKSVKIGICSDLTVQIQHRKLDKLCISKYIDAIVTSEEVGCEKPNIKMFEMIREKLLVSANECLYIGDDYERDIMGAQKAGMIPIWIHGKQNTEVRVIQLLEELEDIYYELKDN